MHNGSLSVSSSHTLKRRFVSVSLGVACTITVSTASVFANDHLAMMDMGHHQQMSFDHAAHMGALDPAHHFTGVDQHHTALPVDHHASFAIDHNVHVHNMDMSHPVMHMDPSVHFTHADPSMHFSHMDQSAHLNHLDLTHGMTSDHTGHVHVMDPTHHNDYLNSTVHVSGGDTHQSTSSDTTGHHNHFFHPFSGNHDSTAQGHTTHTPTADFNLSAATHDFLAISLAGFHTIIIDVGGTKEVVNLHSRLTAGELVAAEQVLAGGQQTITLSHNGQAVGGTIVLDSNLLSAIDHSVGGTIGSLTITHGVQLIDTVGMLTVAGDINNFGSILTASGIAGQTDTISANSIINSFDGSIGSYIGSSIAGLFSADVILNALSSITNSGTISSAGTLSLSAPTVTNASGAGYLASISAPQDVNINTAHLVNSGNIVSALSDINVASSGNLLVENAAGNMQAAHNVNLLANNAALQAMGGDFNSAALNLKAGHGTVNLQADNASGVVNASADNVHLYTSKSDLKLGDIDSDGDPTLASQGNIIINGTIAPTNGANLAIVSGANILSAAGGQLDTRSTAVGGGNGGNLSLIAGANFTVDGSGNVVLTDSANAGKGSTTGGLIDLAGGNGGTGAVSTITTAGTGATGNAGYVEMVAYGGTGLGSGSITLPTAVTVDASSANGQRGDVKIIAGSNGAGPGFLANLGSITGRNITVNGAIPTVGSGMFFDGTGTASNGINSFNATTTPFNSAVTVQGNISATGDVNMTAGQQLTINGNISADGAGGQAGTANLDGQNGHNINLTALGGVQVQGSLSATGGGGAGSGSSTPGQAGGKGGNGGQITLTHNTGGIAFAGIGINGDINLSGGGGGGGAGGSETSNATAGGAGGTAGTLVVRNTTSGFGVGGTIYAYDGGAGGAGGSTTGGVGAGGGGGSSYGGAGGGGGGGTGNSASDFAAGGGGGFSRFANGGGGGGGVFGNTTSGTLSTGGSGGSKIAVGVGGQGDITGASAVGTSGGNGGGIASPGAGGAGATASTTGGAGGQTNIAGSGLGQSGGGAKAVTGHGLLDLQASSIGGLGIGNQTLKIEAGALKVAAGSATGSILNITDNAGVPLDLVSANLGLSNLSLTTSQNAGTTGADGTVNVLGNVSGQQITIKTNGDAGPNNINVLGNLGLSNSQTFIFLTSNGGSVTTSGTGLITALSAGINATGDININSNVGSTIPGNANPFSLVSTNGNVTVNQGAIPMNLSNASVKDGGSILVNTQSSMTAGSLTANNGSINLNVLSGNNGIAVRGPITTGATTGSVTLRTSDTGNITEVVGIPTAGIISNNINLLTNSSIGTSTAPVLTSAVNNGTINTTYGSAGNVFVNDSATGVVTVNAPTASTGTLSVGSQASQLNIPQANFTNVLISDNGPVGNVLLNSGNNAAAIIGNGSGAVTVSATGNIDANANNTGIAGTSTSFTSTSGNIGAARRLQVSGATLTARAANGSVDVQTSTATTVNGAGGTNFNLIDTVAGSPVTVNGPITANNVNIQTLNANGLNITGDLGNNSATSVNVASGGTISTQPGASISAGTINFDSSTNSIALGQSLSANSLHLSTNTGVVTVATAATPGDADQVSAGGNLSIQNDLSATGPLNISAAGNMTIGSASNAPSVSGDSVSLSSQSLSNYGTVNGSSALTVATSAGGIQNQTTGVLSSNNTNNLTAVGGSLNNAGLIAGAQTSITADQIDNTGSITGANSFNSTGSITNSGSIVASNLTAFGKSITNSGNISGDAVTLIAEEITNNNSINTTSDIRFVGYGVNGATNTSGASLISGRIVDIDTTPQNAPIYNAGTISGQYGVQLTSFGGGITNASAGSIYGQDFVNFRSTLINNQGVASTDHAMTFENIQSSSNPTSDMTIYGGTYNVSPAGTLTFVATGNISINPGSPQGNPFPGIDHLGTFAVNAGGNFSSPITHVSVSDGDSGGFININAAKWLYNGSAPLTDAFHLTSTGLNAPGYSAGTVLLNLTNSDITIGNAPGNFAISATGGNGGQAIVSASGNLTVNTPNLVLAGADPNGTGSTVSLASGNNLLIKGNLDTHTGSGPYGNITLASGAASPFLIDGTKTNTLNGQIGITNGQGLLGKNLTITSPGGVSLARNYVISGPDSVTVNGSGLTNNGAVNTDNLTIAAVGNGNLTTGTTGIYQNLPMQSVNLSSQNGNFTVNGGVPTANTVNISAANGAAIFSPNTSSINAVADADGNGGSININAKSLTDSGLALNARGTTGNGGNVNLNLTGTTALKVENGEVEIDVTNASGKAGGNVTVANGGNISIDARYLKMGSNFAVGEGANLSLSSGNKLYIDHTSNLGNALNNLTLASNSTSAFNLGGASSSGNGIGDNNRVLQAVNLNISNTGDGIVRGNNSSLKADSVSLSALGNIGQANTPIVVNTPTLNLSSTNGSAYINLRTTPSTNFNANVANTLNINATGSINSDQLVSAGSLYLDANGINSGAFPSSTLTTKAGFVSAIDTHGAIDIHDINTSNVSLGTVTAGSSVNLVADGSMTTTQAINAGSDVTLSASNGSLQVGNTITAANNINLTAVGGGIQIGNTVSGAQFVNLNALEGGSITDASNGNYRVETRTLNLTTEGGSIGTNTRAFRTNTESVNLYAGSSDDVFVANTNTNSNGIVSVGGNFGSLNFVDTNTSNNNHGILHVGPLSAGTGAISVSGNERTMEMGGSVAVITCASGSPRGSGNFSDLL